MVSGGYVVVTPDIHYIVGKTGESVCNSVVSAAQYIATLPWVDTSRMGISGHSFGGYETNYLITHSNLLAAAGTAAGPSNLLSFYGGIQGPLSRDRSGQQFVESQQIRMGASPWQIPESYISNSPVYRLNAVTAPVLIMHNKKDISVPWMQSVELFTGLRRLGKSAWMLQYDNGGHGLWHRSLDAIDFTIRTIQFFDHYLKGTPPPGWMTQGRPAKLKGIDDRFELDLEGSCGDSCKICREKNYDMNAVLDVMNPNKKREEQQSIKTRR